MDRTTGLLRRLRQLPDDRLRAALGEVPRFIEEHRSIWTDGNEPPPFDRFVQLLDGSSLHPRQVRAFDEAGVLRAADLVSPLRRVQEVCLFYGKGSGKDWMAARFIAWAAHVLLSMRDPCAHFGLAPATPIHVLNVAPSEDQARRVFFAYLKRNVKQPVMANWLRNERSQILADEIRYPDYGISLYSMHSRSGGLDGYNTFAWILDEADEFLDTAKRSNADEIHNVLRSTANTRYKGWWVGLVLTYMRVEGGFAQRLEERAANDPTIYVDKASTYEVRPDITRDDPGINSDYLHDPADAMARYENIPMSAESGFFEFPEKVLEATDPAGSPVAVVELLPCVTRTRGHEVLEYVSASLVSVHARKPGTTFFLGGDGGATGDSFALAVMSIDQGPDTAPWLCPECGRHGRLREQAVYQECRESTFLPPATLCGLCGMRPSDTTLTGRVTGWWKRELDTAEEIVITREDGALRRFSIPHIREELLVEICPRRAMRPGEKNRPVDFVGVQTLVQGLITQLPVARARFDQWQTVQMTQALIANTSRDVDEISFSRAEQYRRARLCKIIIYNKLLTMLPNAKRDSEWRRLTRRNDSIDHPPGGSKDLYDAESIAIWLAATWACKELELV